MSDLNVNSPEQKAKTITIKKNTIILNVLRSDLVEVKESGDGVIFSLKGGMDLSVVGEYEKFQPDPRILFNK